VLDMQKPIHHPSNTALLVQYCAMYSCHNIYSRYKTSEG